MIKAIIFDLDNTLLDFMQMKSISINAAVDGMIKSGMSIDKNKSIDEIQKIDEKLINKFAPKVVEGVNKLKKWSESL